MDFVIEYNQIREFSYDVFETYLLPYISTLLDDDLRLKDLTLLSSVNRLQKVDQNQPTQIAQIIGSKINTVTNRLSRLEDKNYISRLKSELDQRQTNIDITEKGRFVLATYSDIVSEFSKELGKSFRLKEITTLISGYIKISNNFTDELPLKWSILKIGETSKVLQTALSRFYNHIYQLEEAFFEKHQLSFTPREWLVLTEIYLQSQNGKVNLKSLTNRLNLKVSTISAIIQRNNDQWIYKEASKSDQRKMYLNIAPQLNDTIEAFIKFRIQNANAAFQLLSTKEFEVLKKASRIIVEKIVNH